MLRVQSEGVEIEMGNNKVDADRLPVGRHSGLWASKDAAHLDLARRKHRPKGSRLQQACSCKKYGATFCVLYRIHMLKAAYGQRLSERTSYEVLRDFRSDLIELKVPRAAKYGLKSFRAGKATHMAASGETLSAILECGEWRSSALLKYISETEIDKSRFLAQTLCDDEADELDAELAC